MSFLKIKNYSYIVFGALIYAIGINFFIVPSKIFTLGVLGLSQEISYIVTDGFGLASIIYFTLNIPILFLAWFKVGKKFTVRSFITILMLSLFQNYLPDDIVLIDDVLLNVFTGSILVGFGLGLILRQGASTGGTDVLAMYLSLTYGKTFGSLQIVINIVVMLLAYYVTGEFSTIIYMLISLYAMGVLVDKIHNSHQKLTLIVVTTMPAEIRDAIFENIGRGCTILDSYGGQQFNKNSTVMVTISKQELYLTIKTLKEVDEKSFVNVLPVETVVGFFQNNFKRILE